MKYGIKLSADRFIDWCDSHWYETVRGDHRPFTYPEALAVIQQLMQHFRYHVTLVSDEGEVQYDFGKVRVQPAPVATGALVVEAGDFLLF